MTDACTDVKSDLEAGSYTRFTSGFPIYIEDEDEFDGGDVYIILRGARRSPIQTVSGSVLITPRTCTLEINAVNKTYRENLYLDIIDILTATSRGYKLEVDETDVPSNPELFQLTMRVSMLL